MVETQGLEKNDIWELLRGKKSRVQLLQEKDLQLVEIQKKISIRDYERRMSAGRIQISEKNKILPMEIEKKISKKDLERRVSAGRIEILEKNKISPRE